MIQAADLSACLEWDVVVRRRTARRRVLFGFVVLRLFTAAAAAATAATAAAAFAEPSICSRSPMTFSLECFWPSFSQRSSLSRPSINTGEPLLRYSLAISAVRPHSVMSTNVASSTH